MDRRLNSLWKGLVHAHHLVKFIFFLGLAFLIRLPFFFRDYIDRDESTFILLGQSLVDGHLPYTELWDLKPPLLFFFFGGLIALFGKSFIAIRFTAVLIVALTALLTFLIARRISDNTPLSLLAGILSIYLVSLFGSMQGLMSEHISTLFFLFCIYLLIQKREMRLLLAAGIFMGISLMVKTNIAYATLLLLVFLSLPLKKNSWHKSVWEAAVFGVGLFLVIVLTYIPYAAQGLGSVWINSVYYAPLAYTSSATDQVLRVVPLGLIVAVFLFISWRYKLLNWRDNDILLLILMLIGIVFSFFRVGKVNGHYLIQVYPILLVLLVIILAKTKWILQARSAWFILIFLLLAPIESYREGAHVIRHKSVRGSWFNGEGITVPAFLREEQLMDKNVFFLEYHIGYWLIDQNPPTKAATHPSNICRSELFPHYNETRTTGLEEIQFIMEEIKPDIVVIRKNRAIFDKENEEENIYVTTYLDENYSLHAEVDNANILMRSGY